jgi:hypothetical protein
MKFVPGPDSIKESMRSRIDTSGTQPIVTRAAEPRLNFETGYPKIDTATG